MTSNDRYPRKSSNCNNNSRRSCRHDTRMTKKTALNNGRRTRQGPGGRKCESASSPHGISLEGY
ncbi:hypothetical protein LY78DRAFT_657166 [Colletotrichum sublineola]|nr:hypothetical protein LY78DRAFT_657166 [Colletotrichum sublineola]